MDAQFSPDGLQVLTAAGDEFDFNVGGHRLITAPGEHAARLWDAATGQQLFRLQHASEVNSAQFSPDGQGVLTTCAYSVEIWDAHTGQPRFPLLQYADAVLCAGFSRDGTQVVTGSSEGTVRILEARSGKTLTSLAIGIKANVPSAELSADSHRLLTVLGDGRVRLWDVATGLPLTEPLPRPGEGLAAKFSPYERWVLITSKEQPMAYVWGVPLYLPPVPAWLPELAEALAGQRVDALGRSDFVSCQNVLRIKQKLQQSPSRGAYEHWARWFFSEGSSRTLSPNSHITSGQ
jgi:WD40 repeat protein